MYVLPNANQGKRYITFQIKSKGFASSVYNSSNFQSIYLLDTAYQNDILQFIPRKFKISTNNGSDYFNIDMLRDTSSVIDNLLKSNPNLLEYHLDIKDDENVLGKFAQAYQGKSALFDEDQLPVSFKITRNLNLICFPNFMKPANMRSNESRLYTGFNKSNVKENEIEINRNNFNMFLKLKQTQFFIIKTNRNEYRCNAYAVYSSKVIREILEKDPTTNMYVYNFEDEFNEFQTICDLFNFQSVDVTKNNMDALNDIINDLQITYLSENITKIIENYENFSQTVDDQQKIIDSIEEVFQWLYSIKDTSVESVQNLIIKSKWITTEEYVQELAAFIIQVIKSDFTIQSYIYDLLIALDKESTNSNYLKILLPFITDKLMNLLGSTLTISSFIYILYKKGIVSKERLLYQIELAFSNDMNSISHKKTYYKEKKNMNNVYARNIYLWFLPELYEIQTYKIRILNHVISQYGNDLDAYINSFLPDKIELYNQIRDEGEPIDPLTKALRSDDVDKLQSIITNINNDDLPQRRIPFNIYEEYIPNGSTNYLNYAAAYGSLKCFKYLLLNHFDINKSTFSCAVYGGNIEIIKIVDQNDNNNDTPINTHAFNNHTRSSEPLSSKEDKILPAIMKHRNDIFDWIIEKYDEKSDGKSYEFLIINSALNGNAHSLIEILDKGYDLESNFNMIIDAVSDNGYYHLAKLLIMFNKAKLYKSSKSKDLYTFNKMSKFGINNDNFKTSSISFGNLSLFKLHIGYYGLIDLMNPFYYAIKHDFINIINYYFNVLVKNKGFFITNDVIFNSLSSSINEGKDENFKYLIELLKNANQTAFDLYTPNIELLNISCMKGKVESSKTIIDILCQKNVKYDYTNSFLNATCFGSFEICEYIIKNDLKVNFDKIITMTSIASIKKEILSLIIDKVSIDSKEQFLNCFLNLAIKKQNKDLVEYILNENIMNDFALIEAVKCRNLDIINLILDHNSNPSFINKKTSSGTALSIAINNTNQNYIDENDDKITLQIVQRILSIPGIDPSIYDSDNFTPLMLSIKNINLDVANAILDFYGDNIQSQTWQLNKVIKLILKLLSSKQTNNNNNKIQSNGPTYNNLAKNNNNNQILHKIKKSYQFIPILKRILEINNIDLNCHSGKYTLLSYACETNEINIVKMLLMSDKVDVNSYAPADGNTPLIIAIKNDNFEIAKLLIDYPQTDINISNFDDETALIIGVKKKLPNIIDLLINDPKFNPNQSRLNYAFYISEDIEISKKLLALNSLDVNYKNVKIYKLKNSNTTYQNININGNIKNRISVDSEATTYDTKLILAIQKNDFELINLIIKHHSFDKNKSLLNKSIFNAIDNDELEIFKILIKCSNEINFVNSDNISLLCYAVYKKNQELVSIILNNENFDSHKSDILTAFTCSYSSIDIMNQLYNYDQNHDHLIDLTKTLPNGESFFTSFHIKNNIRNQMQVNRGVNQFNNDDNNIYIDRKFSDDDVEDFVNFLCKNGCDPNKPDDFGIYPLQYAINLNSENYVLALINTGKINYTQKINIENQFAYPLFNFQNNKTSQKIYKSYLHLAARLIDNHILSIFLERNLIDINITDDLGETPLFEAVRFARINNINLLFEYDNLNYLHLNNEGKDALMIRTSMEIKNRIEDKQLFLQKLRDSFRNQNTRAFQVMGTPP